MLAYILFGLFLLSCIVLVATVLLQPGKADAGALFSNTVSTTAFGARGTQTLLSKITIGAAASFMLTALLLSVPGISGTRSVISGTEKAGTVPAATPLPATTPAGDANSNTNGAATSASPAATATTPAATATPAVKATPEAKKAPATAATPAKR